MKIVENAGCRFVRIRYMVVLLAVWTCGTVLCIAIITSWQSQAEPKRATQEQVWSELRARCGSCSLVTNSGDIIGSYAGSEVDEADCVIRINNGPTKGFEDDVGKKTTLRTFDGVNVDALVHSFSKGEPDPQFMIIYYSEWSESQSVQSEARLQRVGETVVSLLYGNDTILRHGDQLLSEHGSVDKRKSVAFLTFVIANEICRHDLKVYGMISAFYCDNHKEFKHDAPKHYYPPGDREKKCPMDRNYKDVFWTSSFDAAEAYAVQQTAEISDRIHLRQYYEKF